MVRVKSCVRELMELSSSTMTPPPSTVSIVRASRLGVSASKSCPYHVQLPGKQLLACAAASQMHG